MAETGYKTENVGRNKKEAKISGYKRGWSSLQKAVRLSAQAWADVASS